MLTELRAEHLGKSREKPDSKTVLASVWPGQLLIIAIYALLTVILIYPVTFRLTAHIPGYGDAPRFLWNLGWFTFLNRIIALVLSLCSFGLHRVEVMKRGLGAWRRREEELSWPAPRISVRSVLLILIIVLPAWLCFRLAEEFVVLDGAGVYPSSGIQRAERGELFASGLLLKDLSPSLGRKLVLSGLWTMGPL